jgi:DNA/RNA-binding domain of Phe-tRNA-synthetase-like protein
METWEWIVLAVAIAVAVVLVLAFVRIRRRRSHLQERFGREYEHAVSADGVSAGERRLDELERERQELDIRQLSPAARERYLEEWRQAEARFVSDPRDATRAAERLVGRVLEERGYPQDEDDRARVVALVSVDHPDVADRFRHGQSLLENVDGSGSTENLRKAMLDFRAVLEDVLFEPSPA